MDLPKSAASLIEFRDELPRTTVGKVLKRELVKEYEDQLESTPA